MAKQTASSSREGGHDVKTMLLVWGTIADTSWRMFVPVLGLTAVGYGLDGLFRTRPVLIIAGMSFGIVVAVWLVVLQYRSTKPATPPRGAV